MYDPRYCINVTRTTDYSKRTENHRIECNFIYAVRETCFVNTSKLLTKKKRTKNFLFVLLFICLVKFTFIRESSSDRSSDTCIAIFFIEL